MVYLLSEQIFEKVRGQVSSWENQNLNFGFGCWVSEKSFQWIQEHLGEIPILASRNPLPIFFGDFSAANFDIADDLTALCLSRADSTSLQAIVNLSAFGDYRHCMDLGRCVTYGGGYWHVIGHAGDLEWVQGYWSGDERFSNWLQLYTIVFKKIGRSS